MAVSSDSAVRLEGVTKRFGDVAAVDSIDLDVRDGEFFSMLGPSGSGKTTTLRMIAGFELPTSGRVLLHGQLPDLGLLALAFAAATMLLALTYLLFKRAERTFADVI